MMRPSSPSLFGMNSMLLEQLRLHLVLATHHVRLAGFGTDLNGQGPENLLGHFGHSFLKKASNMINLNQFDIFGILNSNTTLSGNLVLCRPLDSSLDSVVQHPMDLLMLEMGANINSASINSLGLSGVTHGHP